MSKIIFDKKKKILIQSMTNTKTSDIEATLSQLDKLKNAGVDLVRVAIFDDEDINSLNELVKKSPVPIIADIHFNYMYAIKAIESGVVKIRLNPGNINKENEIKLIIEKAKKYEIPIRIGVNCGSIPIDLEKKYGRCAKAMILALDRYLQIFKKYNFNDIVISLKASDPLLNIEVNEMAFKKYDFPMHLGVTEAGTLLNSAIKSSIGLSPLLIKGIGDTIRISISGDPVLEVLVAKKILNSLNIDKNVVDVIACPTCGRMNYNMIDVVKKVENYVSNMNFPLRISILGCVVNGIGEAKHSDIGIAGGASNGIIFENGKILKSVPENELFDELKVLIDKKYKEFLKNN